MNALWLPQAQAYIRFLDLPGDEPALVFLHGLGSAASADFPAVAANSPLAGRRSILIDFLGFGYSDRPADYGYELADHAAAASAILDSLAIKTAAVIGHSMGGTIAIALAVARPDLAGRLILAEANLDPGQGGGSKLIAAQAEQDYLISGHEAYLALMREEALKEPVLHVYLGTLALADPLAMHRSAVGLLRGTDPPQRLALARMDIPKAFIIGERSLPEIALDGLRALGLQVLIVPGAGHAMMDENPAGFAAAIADAIK